MVKDFIRGAALLTIITLLIFVSLGCEDGGSGSGGSSNPTLTISAADGDPAYISLANGTILDDSAANTASWDLKFTYDRTIHTNSGATATLESSGGTGGVYFVDSATTVNGVSAANLTAAEAVFDGGETGWDTYKHYDDTRYYQTQTTESTQMNVMTYHGYDSGDGLAGTTPYNGYNYDADSFYHNAGGMPPTYVMDECVYIIRHGDGTKHTAVQVSALETSGSDRVYQISYYNLD